MNPVPLQPKFLRPLGALEWLQWTQRINLVFTATVAGPLTEDLLRLALASVQRRHPLLQVSVSNGPGQWPYFTCSEQRSIPLRLISAPSEYWPIEIEQELQQPFLCAQAPLARCILLQHAPERITLVISLSHAIADGRAAGYLLRDLLLAAAAAVRNEAAFLEARPLHPPAETFVLSTSETRSFWKRLIDAWQSFRSALLIGQALALPPERDFSNTSPAYRIIPRRLPPPLVQILIEKARHNQATVHGALCTAQLLAVADEFPDRAVVPLYLVCPVNLQGRIVSSVTDDVLLFASGLDSLLHVTRQQPFWELANELTRRFRAGPPQRESLIATMRSLQIVHSLQRWLPTDEERRARFFHWAERFAPPLNVVTNMGVLPIPVSYGPFHLESFGFFVNTPATVLMSSAATLNGCLFWNFVYQTHVLSPQRAERLADRALRLLREATAE